MKNNKKRLFEMMSKIDNSFKPKLNENIEEINKISDVINPKYTHFAVLKDTNKIVNGWNYSGYNQDELKEFKKDYFFNDLIDMGFDPKTIKILTANYLQKMNINPYDKMNWV